MILGYNARRRNDAEICNMVVEQEVMHGASECSLDEIRVRKEAIDSVCSECTGNKGGWCLAAWMLTHSKESIPDERCGGNANCPIRKSLEGSHISHREISQTKCVSIYRFKLGERGEPDLQFKKAYHLWIERGYAEAFSRTYSIEFSPEELYDRTEDRVVAKEACLSIFQKKLKTSGRDLENRENLILEWEKSGLAQAFDRVYSFGRKHESVIEELRRISDWNQGW